MSLSGNSGRPLWQTILMLPLLVPYWLWVACYTLLSYPFSINQLEQERRQNLYWGMPAIFFLLVTFFATLHTLATSRITDNRYRVAMKRAMSESDFKLATILGGRLVSDKSESDSQTRFTYALALRQSGEVARADAILADLAPSDQPGFAPAHRMRAMTFAAQLQTASSESVLEQLRWHLENSGEEQFATIEKLWTAYYVKVGLTEQALPHMEIAAKLEPRLLIFLAKLYEQTGKKVSETRALQSAETVFKRRLEDDPLNREDRMQLVQAQLQLGKADLAEKTLLKGVEIHNDSTVKRRAAQFYLTRYDSAVIEKPEDLQLQLAFLEKALSYDLFFADAYERMIAFYQKSSKGGKENAEAKRVQEILETTLVEGSSPALTHFALSSIYQIQGNAKQTEWHLFQSYRLDSSFPIITNNLAWVMANSDNPDLPRAYELSLNAVRAWPNDARFRDTYATILMKQGKTQEAIAEFEAILGIASDKTSIHRKLAELYGTLGKVELSRKHKQKADELAQLAEEKAKKG